MQKQMSKREATILIGAVEARRRLDRIVEILELLEGRCANSQCDFREEITPSELHEIYKLAKGR